MDPMLILCESYETAAFCVVMLRRTESLLKRLASHPQGLGHPLGHPLGTHPWAQEPSGAFSTIRSLSKSLILLKFVSAHVGEQS